MPRRKKPENETPEMAAKRHQKEKVSNHASRSEKTSWNRKMDNMVKLLAMLRPIERQIIELNKQKMPIFDDIQELRGTMVRECVHPYEYLVQKEGHLLCKFCEKRIGLPEVTQDVRDET